MATVRQAMMEEVATIRPQMSLQKAAELILRHGVCSLPVENNAGEMLGFLTEHDLLRAIAAKELHLPVSAYMSRHVVTAQLDEPLEAIAERLLTQRLRRLPVVEGNTLVGMISRRNLLAQALSSGDPTEVPGDEAAGKPLAEIDPNEPLLRIVVVDDDPLAITIMVRLIHHRFGQRVELRTYHDALQAETGLREHGCELVMTDIDLPGPSGIELCRRVKAMHPWCRVIAVTGHRQRSFVTDAMTAGASDFLFKPIDRRDFFVILDRVAHARRRWNALTSMADEDAAFAC